MNICLSSNFCPGVLVSIHALITINHHWLPKGDFLIRFFKKIFSVTILVTSEFSPSSLNIMPYPVCAVPVFTTNGKPCNPYFL